MWRNKIGRILTRGMSFAVLFSLAAVSVSAADLTDETVEVIESVTEDVIIDDESAGESTDDEIADDLVESGANSADDEMGESFTVESVEADIDITGDVAAQAQTDTLVSASEEETETETTDTFPTSGALTTGTYTLTSDVSLTGALTIAEDETVTIDVNFPE